MRVNIKKIIYWLFSMLIVIFVVYILLINYISNKLESEPFDASKHFFDYTEERIGMSCEDFYDLAIKFIDDEIKVVIKAGEKGEDWLAIVSDSKLEKIDSYEKNAYSCMLTKSGEENNKHKPIQEMLAALKAFSIGSSRTSKNLKPEAEAFELIKQPYYRILSQRGQEILKQ